MPFPFTIEGRVDLPAALATADNEERMLTLLDKRIADLNPRQIQRDGNQIKFYGNVFRIAWITNWNHLAMVGRGVITVRSDPHLTISYTG